MRELEVKVMNIDKLRLEEKLIDIGAVFITREKQVNTIFMDIDSGIEEIGSGYLRIRESTDLETLKTTNMITFKKSLSKDTVRENEEIETNIGDRDKMVEILRHLGINVMHRGEKERISYRFENMRFDIDTWDKETYPNPYLEIEVSCLSDLEKAIRLLDLDREDITTKSLKELREDLKEKRSDFVVK